MTKRERVLAAIQFKPVDRLPHNLFLNTQTEENVIAYTGDPDWLSKAENHIAFMDLNMPQTSVAPGFDRDEYGVVWNKTGADKDIGVLDNILIRDWEDLERYVFPPVDEAFIRRQMEALTAADPELFKVAAIGFSLFERVWTLMGFENTLCNMCADPQLVHVLFDKVCERDLEILDIALEYDFDAFYFGDDWGQQQGLIMGKPHWEEFIEPRLRRLYDRVHRAGKFVGQHSCGDIRQILPKLAEMGLNIYQTFQPEIYGLDYASQLHGKIAVWGGISTQVDLPYRRPEEIRPLVQATAAAFGGTGLILAPTHGVPFDVPPQNLVALVDAFLHPDVAE